ncbi:MAG: FixH family protein [Chloroflexi bacterium]|nr:FixH family protein [Chloroflexota bacterium]
MTRMLVLLVAITVALVGCRESAQTPTATPENVPQIDIALEAEATSVGETVLIVTVTDATGAPVEAQEVRLRGDMAHAGMMLVQEQTDSGEDGVYRIPFGWTMGGSWTVTVTVVLTDGTTVEDTFDFEIDS